MSDKTTYSFGFDGGCVLLDAADGSPLTVQHPAHGPMNFLLPEAAVAWHQPPARWGKGFVIVPGKEAGRWDQPQHLSFNEHGSVANYEPIPGLKLQITRRYGDRWTEHFRFTNHRDTALELGSIGISTPFADHYPSARACLSGCCHAHVWTGGADGYVWAVRMDGSGPGLGLRMLTGDLCAYSIESRDTGGQSNGRGNLYLHPTDAARNPTMLAGQPTLHLPPGDSYEFAWELGWYVDAAAFERARNPLVTGVRLAAEMGEAVELKLAEGATLVPTQNLSAQTDGYNLRLRSQEPGLHVVEIARGDQRGKAAILFHPKLEEVVRRRVAFILQHQIARERGEEREGAFLPLSNDTRLSVLSGAWGDWSDGRERLAMPLLLLQARLRGWGNAEELDAAIDGFARFARHWLIREEGKVSGSSYDDTTHRLYNSAWMAEFFFTKYGLSRDRADLQTAHEILSAYYRNGGNHFLAFIDCAGAVANALETEGDGGLAEELRGNVKQHADYYLELGDNLPAHEVNYEQSIVAPLILLMQEAFQLTADPRYLEGIARYLPWLDAFAGTQPDVRLCHVPIRHWDGFWFGRERHWGDIFPHYWSVLSAAVYANEFARTGEARFAEKADAIFRANLVAFFPDGSASCAFVYPSCVNGNPVHRFDPLANDQDWALVWYLKSKVGAAG